MKHFYYILTIILSLFISACKDEENPVDGDEARGSIYIQTTNATGARIWVDNTNTGKTTPDTIKNLTIGNHNVTLKLDNFRDTTFTIIVSANQSTSIEVALTSSLSYGSIYIQTTNAAGAQIWVDNWNTGKVTPDSVSNLTAGNHTVTLKLAEYRDTTFTLNVYPGLQNSRAVALTSSLSLNTYVDTLWETTGTTAAQPSGLDLSAGKAVSTGNADHDIFYSSSGFVIRSSTTRGASFFVGSGKDLDDGANSPIAAGSWATSVSDREDNYFYIFDADLHYSKMKIISFGGGTPGNPAWVIVEWRYNTIANDILF